MSLENLENKIELIWRRPVIFLILIGVISLSIKLYYLPNFPLSLDSLDYFFYATDISVNQKIPENYTPANNGWPIFLSLFFSIANFENIFSYMQLQRIISIFISTFTIIPIYFLAKKFFNIKLALVGSVIFAFEPKLIQNSVLGITDALYIFLISATLITFLGTKKFLYLSFVFASLATLVRSEGVVLLFIISILFFIKFRDQKKEIPKFIFAIGIMALILVPMMLIKTEASGNDIIFTRVVTGVSVYNQYMQDGNEYGKNPLLTGIENFLKYFVWNLIPIFILVPVGIFFLFKKINFNKIFIIVGIIICSIPAFWAYSLPLQDLRYLYFIYPFFILISLYPLEKILNKKYVHLIFSLIVSIILLSSLTYLEFKIENERQEEAYLITKEISKFVQVTNEFPPESKFVEVINYPVKWEDFIPLFKQNRQENTSIRIELQNNELVDPKKFRDLQDMINNSSPKLTHVVVDDTMNEDSFLYEVYQNEEKYFYLEKKFDSKIVDYNYHVKVFKIDYEKFNEFN